MKNESHLDARVLIVDDEVPMVEFLTTLLFVAGYTQIRGVTDSREAALAFEQFTPDLVLLDLNMPILDGLDVLEQLQALMPEDAPVPVVMLTASHNEGSKTKALEMGASDYISKPFSPIEVRLRIANLLTTRFVQLSLRNQNRVLRNDLRSRADDDAERFNALKQLAIEAERKATGGTNHPQRVANLAGLIAEEMDAPEEDRDRIHEGAFLHDIGKIGIPEEILHKPGSLTGDEFEVVKRHTALGASILSGADNPVFETAREIAITHHERWDGTGYAGLTGEAIPLGGRITALAETFDVLVHDRPHRKAISVADAIDRIAEQTGTQFDPDIVRAFLRVFVATDLDELAGPEGVIDITDGY